MADDASTLYAKLLGETAAITWQELQPFFARGALLQVAGEADLVEVDKLEALAAKVPGFTFQCCVADEASAYPHKGYVTHHMGPEHLNGGDVDVYLCGPPAMVDAVRSYMAENGITPTNFYFEKFANSGVVTATGETHKAAA